MEKATNIMRSSIHSFFTSYQTFASIATILLLPSSASTLIHSSLNPSSSSSFLHLLSLQNPTFSHFFHLKFLHTILSSLLSLPFSLTSLPLAKASIILAGRHELHHYKHPSILRLYRRLALAQLLNTFLILSTNAAFFSLMFLLGFNSMIPAVAGILLLLHSAIITNTFMVCNLASIVAAMEDCRAGEAVVKAFGLVKGRAVVALWLAVPTNLAMAAVESVFQIRVMRPYYESNKFYLSFICEGFTITYMYSILVVLDVITTCCFYNSCKFRFDHETELGEEEGEGVEIVRE